jgi:flagellar L-ring protein precursor FlgH
VRALIEALVMIGCVLVPAASARGQSSSLYHGKAKGGEARAGNGGQRDPESYSSNPVLDQTSLIAVELADPKVFQVHDIITIIVQEQKIFESDAETESRRRFELRSELEAWARFYPGVKLGADLFTRGNPNIDYRFDSRVTNEGELDREDLLVTRIAAEVIDVKPNGNLVLEARKHIWHDEEEIVATLTGLCRSDDVTADNTILSSKVADFSFTASHTGAVRDASRRGWVTRLLDFLRPI